MRRFFQNYLPAGLLGLLCWGFAQKALAQRDSLPNTAPDAGQQIIEDFLQNVDEGEGGFDFNTQFEPLEAYLRRPLNLNKADEASLLELGLLSDVQVLSLLQYRRELGPLIAVQELQAVPHFDLESIGRILPYVGVGERNPFGNLRDLLAEGEGQLFLRYERGLEERRGYLPPEAAGSQAYEGSPDAYYLRYRFNAGNQLSIGLTAEKDAGEAFFAGSNPQGFDFYSAHAYARDLNGTLRAIALGDFSVSMGQGLVLFNGFATGKSAFVMNLRRVGRTLRPYSSVNEANFMRGAGVSLGAGRWELTAFASQRRRDANIDAVDSLDNDVDILSVSSLQITGLHRTAAEVADENAISVSSMGGVLKYEGRGFHVALNGLYERLSEPLLRRQQLYNQFDFQGDRLLNLSLDYAFQWRNAQFFGEAARSDNGGLATLHGLLLGLGNRASFSMLFRNYAPDYHALQANAFGESSTTRNETGLYAGLSLNPARQWRVDAYFDVFRHPWLRFGVDGPSSGHEYLLRVTYFQKRRLELYAQVRNEIKQVNAPDNETPTDVLVQRQRLQARLHFSYSFDNGLGLRNRFEYSRFDNTVESVSAGYLLYQDVLWSPKNRPIALSARYAIFHAPDFDARLYAFENDLLYNFSIPAYFGSGTRFYVNLRYRLTRQLTLEGRYAITSLYDRDSIGSAGEAIEGNRRSEIKFQLRWRMR